MNMAIGWYDLVCTSERQANLGVEFVSNLQNLTVGKGANIVTSMHMRGTHHLLSRIEGKNIFQIINNNYQLQVANSRGKAWQSVQKDESSKNWSSLLHACWFSLRL